MMFDLYGTAFDSRRFEASLRNCSSEGAVVSACHSAEYAIDEDCSQRRRELFSMQDELDEMKTFIQKLTDELEGHGEWCLSMGIDGRELNTTVDGPLAAFDDMRNRAATAALDAEDALNAVSRRREHQLDAVEDARRIVLRKLNNCNE